MHKYPIVYAAASYGAKGMGAGNAAIHELRALTEWAGDPVLALANGDNDMADIENVDWLNINFSKIPPPSLTKTYAKQVWYGYMRNRRLQKVSPQAIVVQGAGGHRSAVRYREWESSFRIMTLHSSPDQVGGTYSGEGPELDRFEAEAYQYDAIVCPSSRVAERWKSETRLSEVPFHVIPNHCDEKAVEKAATMDTKVCRRMLGISEQEYVIVCLASVQHRKGQDLLVEAVERIHGEISNLGVYLVGPVIEQWGGRDITESIGLKQLADVIHVAGRRPDPLIWLRAADVMVLPSREECLPISILESMALGTPVICSNVDGNPEMIENQSNGWTFPNESPQLLGQAILESREPKRRLGYAELGKEKYWLNFSRAEYVRKWQKVLQEESDTLVSFLDK